MATVHMIVGSLVLLAFLALTVVYVLRFTGREIGWARQLSFAAAGLLLLQYVLGFILLGGDNDITAAHYVIALAAIVTVGFEHGYARTRETERSRASLAAVASGATTLLVLIAYAIGQSH